MVLTKDHVKVLMQIEPKSESPQYEFLPQIESLAHSNHLNEVVTEMQAKIAEDGSASSLGLSAIRRHLKACHDQDNNNGSPSKQQENAAA